jgi:hypothetical protein
VPGLELNPAHRPVDNYSYTVEGPTQSIPFARTTVWWGTGQRSEAQQLEPVLIFLGAPATQLARSPLLCFSCMAWCTILLTIFSIKPRVILRQPTRLTVSLFFFEELRLNVSFSCILTNFRSSTPRVYFAKLNIRGRNSICVLDQGDATPDVAMPLKLGTRHEHCQVDQKKKHYLHVGSG